MGFFPENVLGQFSLLGTVPSFPCFIPSFFTEGENRPDLVEVLVDLSPYIWKKAPGCCSYAYTQGAFLLYYRNLAGFCQTSMITGKIMGDRFVFL